jgi:hypothetical protein
MIWIFSPNNPIVETIYNPKSEQFRATDSKISILKVSGLDPTPYNLQPIYLRLNLGKCKVHKRKSRPGVRVPPLTLDPIYVCPDDIVYMSEIYDLDVDTFLANKENQVIENLAIYSSSAEKLMGLQYPWTLANRTSEGKLVRGLDNLKTLYVVDGSLLGQDGREKHPGNCNYILKEVVEGKAPHPGLRSGTLVPWNSGTAHVIRLVLDFEETPYNPKPLSYSNTKSRYDVPYSLYLYNETRRYFLQRVKKQMDNDRLDGAYIAGAGDNENEWIQRYRERFTINWWLLEHDVDEKWQEVEADARHRWTKEEDLKAAKLLKTIYSD